MTPKIPLQVEAAFADFPAPAQDRLRAARDAIFETASGLAIGPLIETLKWGEPAYLPQKPGVGTTIRLGLLGTEPVMLFHCQTTLVESFRTDLPGVFRYSGNRALVLTQDDDPAALALCISRALTYHRTKGGT